MHPVHRDHCSRLPAHDAGRLLLVRKRNTLAFMLPGGKAEPGEDPIAALTRELNEELNLSLPANALRPLAACRTFPVAGRIAHRSWNLTV